MYSHLSVDEEKKNVHSLLYCTVYYLYACTQYSVDEEEKNVLSALYCTVLFTTCMPVHSTV